MIKQKTTNHPMMETKTKKIIYIYIVIDECTMALKKKKMIRNETK